MIQLTWIAFVHSPSAVGFCTNGRKWTNKPMFTTLVAIHRYKFCLPYKIVMVIFIRAINFASTRPYCNHAFIAITTIINFWQFCYLYTVLPRVIQLMLFVEWNFIFGICWKIELFSCNLQQTDVIHYKTRIILRVNVLIFVGDNESFFKNSWCLFTESYARFKSSSYMCELDFF